MTFGKTFLRYPDLFPARAAGEPWGDGSILIGLPGGPYQVQGLSDDQLAAVELRYKAFELTGLPSPIPLGIQVFTADPNDFLALGTGWDYTVDLDHTPDFVRIAAPEFMARFDRNPGKPTNVWTSTRRGAEFSGVIENVLRILVAYRLLAEGGLLVHSSGVVIGDRCLLFAGPSGAGKSTIAGLALEKGYGVLSDDLNLLLRDGDHWVSSRLPFAGTLQSEAVTPVSRVAGILRLQKASMHAIEQISPADAFALIMSSAPFVNADSYVADQLESTVAAIVETIPAWRLSFRKDAGLWPIIESL